MKYLLNMQTYVKISPIFNPLIYVTDVYRTENQVSKYCHMGCKIAITQRKFCMFLFGELN